MECDGVFDFTAKLALYPDHVRAALEAVPGPSLATIFMDLASESCNHDCIFCDGNMYDFAHARFTTDRLLAMVTEIVELGADSLIFAGEKSEPTVHPGFARFAERLHANGIKLGIYTNGSILKPDVLRALAGFEFVRVSMDAGTAETHRLVHGYPAARDDFVRLLEFVSRVGEEPGVAVGVSFIVLAENVREIARAATLAKQRGAGFIELKPMYGPRYSFDGRLLRALIGVLDEQLAETRELEDASFRVVLNNQLRSFLAGQIGADELTTLPAARRCLTSRLRLVVSPRGCYLCTPHRGRSDKSIGNATNMSLVDVWFSARHERLMQERCCLRCTYHEQNEVLLDLEARGAEVPSAESTALGLQRCFL